MMTTTAARSPNAERVELLFRLSQTFSSTLELNDVLARVMDEVIAAVRAERGFVMLRDREGHLTFRAARGIEKTTIEQPEYQVSRGVVDKVASEGLAMLATDAMADATLGSRQSVAMLGLRSILCVPLSVRDQTIGVIYVENRVKAGIFSVADKELLTAIATTAAIAIENARLYEVAVEKGRMEQELRLAHEVQASLLPHTTPDVQNWQFAAYWHPAREVAGDYYDFIHFVNGAIGLVVGDVTDKGMPAALFMALTRSTVRACVTTDEPPAEQLTTANRLICADSNKGMFVTLFYCKLNPLTGVISYVNAGHNPPMIVRHTAGDIEQLKRTGLALGVLAESLMGEQSATLDRGDLLLIYTDGVTDASNSAGEQFGYERFTGVVKQNGGASAEALVTAVKEAIEVFVDGAPHFDDITIVAIRREE